MQLTHPKTPVLKQPETVLVLDAALMVSGDQKLIEALTKISQERSAKIVVVGNMPTHMLTKLQGINIEITSLEDLKQNKNNYSKDNTHCFMSETWAVISRTKIKQNFPCSTTLASEERLSGCVQWKSFCDKFLEKTAAPRKSVDVQQRQSVLLDSGHGIFGASPAAIAGTQAVRPVTSASGTQAAVPQILPSRTHQQLPPVLAQPIRQQPSIPVDPRPGITYRYLYSVSKCLAVALGKPDCEDINLPEISLNDKGCVNIKIKKELVDKFEQNQLLCKYFKLDMAGALIGEFNNINELSNILRLFSFNCAQGGGYYLNMECIKMDADIINFTEEDIMSIRVMEKKLQTPLWIQCCRNSLLSETVSYYFCELLPKDGKHQFTQLNNIDGKLSEFNLEEGIQRKLYISPEENSLVYHKIRQPHHVNFEEFYRELCLKNGRNFSAIWDKVKQPEKYPEKEKFSALLCKKLSENQYADKNLIDLSLDAEGCLQMKVNQDIAKFIFQDTYLTKIFEPGEQGSASAKFENITALKEMLEYRLIGDDELNLENLYQELCDKDGRCFPTIWENVNNTTLMQKLFS